MTDSAPMDRDAQNDHNKRESRCTGARWALLVGTTLLTAAVLLPVIVAYLRKRRQHKTAHPASPQHHDLRGHGRQISLPTRIVLERDAPAEDPDNLSEAAPGADQAQPRFVGSIESNKFHLPGCRWARNIDAENRITFASREAAVAAGYIACQTCRP